MTARAVFEALRYHAAPFQSNRIARDGDETGIPGLGKVKHFVFPEQMTIVNTTLPGHLLHSGNVFRRVVQDGDDIYIETEGYGTGLFPRSNERAASGLWEQVDQSIRRWVNSLVPTSYRENFSSANAADVHEAGGDIQSAIQSNQADAANTMRVRNSMTASPVAPLFFPSLPAIGPRPFLPGAFLPGALGTAPAAD